MAKKLSKLAELRLDNRFLLLVGAMSLLLNVFVALAVALALWTPVLDHALLKTAQHNLCTLHRGYWLQNVAYEKLFRVEVCNEGVKLDVNNNVFVDRNDLK